MSADFGTGAALCNNVMFRRILIVLDNTLLFVTESQGSTAGWRFLASGQCVLRTAWKPGDAGVDSAPPPDSDMPYFVK